MRKLKPVWGRGYQPNDVIAAVSCRKRFSRPNAARLFSSFRSSQTMYQAKIYINLYHRSNRLVQPLNSMSNVHWNVYFQCVKYSILANGINWGVDHDYRVFTKIFESSTGAPRLISEARIYFLLKHINAEEMPICIYGRFFYIRAMID